MLPEIKLVIFENDKMIQAVSKQVDTNFVKTLEKFQVIANATLTELIDDIGGSGDCMVEEEEESDPDEDACTHPKKTKK